MGLELDLTHLKSLKSKVLQFCSSMFVRKKSTRALRAWILLSGDNGHGQNRI